MLVIVKRKRKAMVKLSEKILSSVSGILLKHNYCKLDTHVQSHWQG